MMMKYRVHEVAKDLNVPNKVVIEILQKYCDETKKHMTALTEQELDMVFEAITQKNNMGSLDAYFADNAQSEPQAAVAAPEAAAPQPAAPAQRPQQQAPVAAAGEQPVRKAVKPGKITPVGPKPTAPQQQNQQGRPQQGQQHQNQQRSAHPQGQQNRPQQQNHHGQNAQPQQSAHAPASTADSNVVRKPQGRIVDTRTSNVELDRYNEKYDRMASEKVKTDNVVKKQKLTQRSSQYRGKPRNARRETESERLRRIAQERKQKQMTVTIPEELTVGCLLYTSPSPRDA